MKFPPLGLVAASLSFLSPFASAQHAQVSAVVVDPTNPDRVWVCNFDNGTVSVVVGNTVTEIPVGVHPRSLAVSADGSRVFVANQRGNIPVDVNFVTPFSGSEQRGSLSVISTSSLSVTTTLTNVGVEPYGVAVAPNGKYFAVSGFRSGTVKLYDTTSLSELVSFQYLRNVNQIPPPFTIADVDSNRDGVADLDQPRGFVIRSDSERIYVTHNKSPFVSYLDVTLNPSGTPIAVNLGGKIGVDDYPFDPIFNPVPVQTLQSQGKPRFLEDIALSPDGTRALTPHVLHNVNHDVNHDFGPGFAGHFANRVYPALTVIDTVQNSYGVSGDASARLHHELSDPSTPAEYVPYGRTQRDSFGNLLTLGGIGSPVAGSNAVFVVDGMRPGDTGVILIGQIEQDGSLSVPPGRLLKPRFSLPIVGNTASLALQASALQNNVVGLAQAFITRAGTGEKVYSTGLRFVVGTQGFGAGNMGYRAGHPSRVLFNPAGDHVLMLNRGSEDLFLYKINGSNLELRSVFPPRYGFVPRAALDKTTAMGDFPLGMAMAPDLSTPDCDDARVYIVNEATRTLSTVRVDWVTGTIHWQKDQKPLHQGPDAFTLSERIGLEIFEDASRPQTAGNFNNSCGSCHFEGGDDANVWQRSAGPRSTMPVYGGTLATGLILWKGLRLNMGETGPMFGGENGGTGIFTDAEQQGLVDYHEKLAIPLNPNLDPVTGQYSATAAFGKDLYFGTNATGLNPTLRSAGCATCHPDAQATGSFPGPRLYTADFVDPNLTGGETMSSYDPNCVSLRHNIVAPNLREVNTGANVDLDGNLVPDPDRNSDGYNDLETYAIMNADTADDFLRDDPNSYPCPCTVGVDPNCDPQTSTRIFLRNPQVFSIPTKLGVFGSAPYFHDHSVYSLRALVDPEAQALSPIYGSPAFPTPYPGLNKVFNDVHDVRGHEQFVVGASKVQQTLVSTPATIEADIAAILAYIESL